MYSSLIAIRLALFTLTGAIVGGTTVYAEHYNVVASAAALPVVTLPTITVLASESNVTPAYAGARNRIPTLPTVHVGVTEEERIAAFVDPTDQIQIMSPMTVTASAEEKAAATQSAIIAQAESSSVDDSKSPLDQAINAAISGPRRLRFDMPYYSVGRVLTHAQKN